LYEEISGRRVGIMAVCAEEQDQVDLIMKEFNLRFTCYSDPTHKLRNYVAECNYINPRVSGGENATDSTFYKVHPKISQYKYGVVQPAVLCINKEKTVLFAWAIEPSTMNLGGASDRPVPADIWQVVQGKLDNPDDQTPVDYSRLRRRGAGSICTLV
jgi:hypothetical protein